MLVESLALLVALSLNWLSLNCLVSLNCPFSLNCHVLSELILLVEYLCVCVLESFWRVAALLESYEVSRERRESGFCVCVKKYGDPPPIKVHNFFTLRNLQEKMNFIFRFSPFIHCFSSDFHNFHIGLNVFFAAWVVPGALSQCRAGESV